MKNSVSNNISKNLEIQAQFKKYFADKRKSCPFWTDVDIQPIQDFQDNPETYIQMMTPGQRSVLNQMIFGAAKYKSHYESKETIGYRAGDYCEKTVERSLKYFTSLGLIARNYRHLRTNEYRLSSWFRHPFNRARIYHLLKNIRILPIAILFVTGYGSANTKNVAQNIFENFNISFYNSLDNLSQVKRLSTKKIIASVLFNPTMWATQDGDLKKKVSIMANPIRESIRSIKHIKLTRWGQMMLMPFHDEAIRYAHDRFPSAKPSNPFAYFYGLCREYSARNNLTVDIEAFKVLAHKYNMPEDAKFYFATPMSDNEYYRKDKKPYSTTKTLPQLQAEKNYQKREQGKHFPFWESQSSEKVESHALTDPKVKVMQANIFLDAKIAQEKIVDAEDKYRAAKNFEEAYHGPGAREMLKYNSDNPFLLLISEDQKLAVLQEVHGDCDCPRSLKLKEKYENTALYDDNMAGFSSTREHNEATPDPATIHKTNDTDLCSDSLFDRTSWTEIINEKEVDDDWQPIDSGFDEAFSPEQRRGVTTNGFDKLTTNIVGFISDS